MKKVFAGLSDNFIAVLTLSESVPEIARIDEADLSPSERVDLLVSALDKHFETRNAMDTLKGKWGGVKNAVGIKSAPDNYGVPGRSDRVIAQVLQKLIEEGAEGQNAVLAFCEKNNQYQTVFALLQNSLDRSPMNARNRNKDVYKEPEFRAFVEKVISGNDIQNPADQNPALQDDRRRKNEDLLYNVKYLAAQKSRSSEFTPYIE